MDKIGMVDGDKVFEILLKEINLWAPSTRRWDRGYVRGLENAVGFIEQCKSVGPASQEVAQPEPTATPAPTQPEKCPTCDCPWNGYKCPHCDTDSAQPSEVGPFIEIIFDASNGPMNMVFVEVENEKGQSVNVGEWHDQAEGYSALRIPLGQSTAGSQEQLRELQELVSEMFEIFDEDSYGCDCGTNELGTCFFCRGQKVNNEFKDFIKTNALTASPASCHCSGLHRVFMKLKPPPQKKPARKGESK